MNNYGLLGGDRLSMAEGALQQTGNPLDLAIRVRDSSRFRPRMGCVIPATAAFTAPNRTTGHRGGRAVLSADRQADPYSAGQIRWVATA